MGLLDWLRRLANTDTSIQITKIDFPSESVPPPEATQGAVTWTTDMNVSLPAGRTVEELVDDIMAAIRQGRVHDQVVAQARTQFGLSSDDAELAVDRVCGGMFRAQLGSPDNCPNRANDPIAWLSFQRTIAGR